MNKNQLIEAISAHYDGNRRQAAHALESVFDTIIREVNKGEKVAVTGFGAFEKVVRPSRMVRNPRTGERKRAKKTAVPRFRPGSELKQVLAGVRKAPQPPKPAKKATAKKTTAKKAPAKKTAAKTTTKKTTAKKALAKKTTAKKAPAKKSTAKKAAKKS
ncbi:MAG: HU family DNA-binding protein [Propionibacteriales bacterium]|nr:HU family DNA-binding protein [Propionibacteriales bacterium]